MLFIFNNSSSLAVLDYEYSNTLKFEDPTNYNPIIIYEGEEVITTEILDFPDSHIFTDNKDWIEVVFDFIFIHGEPVDIRVYEDCVGSGVRLSNFQEKSSDFTESASNYKGMIYIGIYNDNEWFNNDSDAVRLWTVLRRITIQ